MSDLMKALEEAVADPTNQSYEVLFIRKMRSIAAQGSAGDDRVVATANGYGALTRLRIAPEMLADLPWLERLAVKAINRAVEEAERQAPPPPLPTPYIDPFDLPPPPRPRSPSAPPPTSGFEPWIESLLQGDLDHFTALLRAVQPIHEHIAHDMSRLPEELWGLLREVDLRLGDPSLNAASARRGAGIDDESILRRFRRFAGVSLTGYIQERHMETAARLAYTSDLALEDVASMLGFASADSLRNAIDRWAPITLEEMREDWTEFDVDFVVNHWFCRGTATTKQAEQIIEQALERNPGMRAALKEHFRTSRDPE